jgi:hypothetical protein
METAIDLYDLTSQVALQAGIDFNNQHRLQASEDNDFKFEALVRLHARACLTASEVRALLVSGHATGAHTRWRTLHELAVVAFVIKDHEQEVAEKYLLHEVIDSAKAADEYERYYVRLSDEPPDHNELARVRGARDRLLQRYGQQFRNRYGWAAGILGKNQNPNLRQLEESVELDHMRPYYHMASHGVHPGIKGSYFSIQDLGTRGKQMAAGPSNVGLADPGHAALISLVQCTVAMLNHYPQEEAQTTIFALTKLQQDAGAAFLAAYEQLVKDEETLQGDNSP